MTRLGPLSCALVLTLAFETPALCAVESFSARTLCAGRRFEKGQTLPLAPGTSLELVVTGFGVDNADRVEVVSLPGVKARLVGRRSFPVPQVTVALTIDVTAPLGKGELRLRYAVEIAGYDRIVVEVLAPAAMPCATPGSAPTRTAARPPP